MSYFILFLVFAFVMANVPWLNERCFFIFQCTHKPVWLRFLEWLVLWVVVGGVAFLLEKRMMGTVQEQGWEFYVVTLSLFFVFAVPSFIYRHVR